MSRQHLESASPGLLPTTFQTSAAINMAQASIGNRNARITPFTVHIPDDSLDQLDTLLSITPIAESTYENSLPNGDRKFGMRRDWLTKAVEEWKTTFDW